MEYYNEGQAIARFKNNQQRTKFLESRQGAGLFLHVNPKQQENGDVSMKNHYHQLNIEELDTEPANKIIENIK